MLDQLLDLPHPSPAERGYTQRSVAADVDRLFGSKQSITHTKLEVFAAEIFERLRIRVRNLSRLDSDQNRLYVLLECLDRHSRYGSREHQEKRVFYELIFKVKQEQREQDVECWRDIVLVMRDFLNAWEVQEQMQARAIFLDHAGS